MASQLAWFATPAGKKFSFRFMCTASITAFSIQLVPHTFGLSKYKEIVSMYLQMKPVPISKPVKQCWDEAIADLSVPQYEQEYLSPFTVFGFDVFHAGSVSSRWGAIVGIPINFIYTRAESIDATPILVNKEPVNWNRRDAKELLESLILSKDAQLYGIAREILMTRNEEPMIRSILAAFLVSSTYLLARGVNKKFQLFQQSLLVRSFFYGLSVLCSYSVWAVQSDLLTDMWERAADKHIAQLDDRYKRGGVEFYAKIMKRNAALRTLLGPDGENTFTEEGNEIHFMRRPRIPISQRKDYFAKLLADIEKQAVHQEEIEIPAQM